MGTGPGVGLPLVACEFLTSCKKDFTFITAADSEIKEGLRTEETTESLGKTALVF